MHLKREASRPLDSGQGIFAMRNRKTPIVVFGMMVVSPRPSPSPYQVADASIRLTFRAPCEPFRCVLEVPGFSDNLTGPLPCLRVLDVPNHPVAAECLLPPQLLALFFPGNECLTSTKPGCLKGDPERSIQDTFSKPVSHLHPQVATWPQPRQVVSEARHNRQSRNPTN